MTDDSDNQNDTDSDEGLEGFTPEQKKAIIKWQNSGTTARFAKVNKQVMKQVQSEMQALRSELMDSLRDLLGGKQDSGDNQSGQAQQQQKDPDVEKRFAAMEREVQKARKVADEEKKLREEQQAKTRVQEERAALENALRLQGVKPELLKSAVALLYTEDKRVQRDENGQIVFHVTRDGFADDLELEQGIGEWLRTPEGKNFAALKPVAGSGATPGKPMPGKKKETRAELTTALAKYFNE